MIYNSAASAKATVDLGLDSSYYRFVHVVAQDGKFATHWSDENLYIPKSGEVLWTGRREIGVNSEGAWIRVIHWTRVNGVSAEREVIEDLDTDLEMVLMGVVDEETIEIEDEVVA